MFFMVTFVMLHVMLHVMQSTYVSVQHVPPHSW